MTDLNDDNFIELATIENGNLKTSQTRRGSASRGNGGVFYDDLTDVLARRTYDESGHYIVRPLTYRLSIHSIIIEAIKGYFKQDSLLIVEELPLMTWHYVEYLQEKHM